MLEFIKNAMIFEFGYDWMENTRKRETVYQRAIYFKLAKDYTNESLARIGNSVGRDHATVLHAINTVFPIIRKWEKDLLLRYHKIQNDIVPQYVESANKEVTNRSRVLSFVSACDDLDKLISILEDNGYNI